MSVLAKTANDTEFHSDKNKTDNVNYATNQCNQMFAEDQIPGQ